MEVIAINLACLKLKKRWISSSEYLIWTATNLWLFELENKEMNFFGRIYRIISYYIFIFDKNQPHGDKITHFFFNKQAKIDSTGDDSAIN